MTQTGSQPRRQYLPRRQDFPEKNGNPSRTGNPRIQPPGLQNPPGTIPTNPAGLPLAISELCCYTSTQKGRVYPD